MGRTRFHLFFLFAAVVVAVLLSIHMAVLHFDGVLGLFGVEGPEPTSYEAVMGRSIQPAWAVLYIALLGFALYHALYGLRGVLLEVTTSARASRVITWLFWIIGIAVFIWGSYVPLALL